MPEDKEQQVNTTANVAVVNLTDIGLAVEQDAFADARAIPGLEPLGRGITDSRGAVSGSPANWEATRGTSAEPEAVSDEEQEAAVAGILSELLPKGVNSAEQAEPEQSGESGEAE